MEESSQTYDWVYINPVRPEDVLKRNVSLVVTGDNMYVRFYDGEHEDIMDASIRDLPYAKQPAAIYFGTLKHFTLAVKDD